jgi:hypothetical protein
MDRQRQRPAKSKSKRRSGGKRTAPEPVLIAARRPNSPLMVKARASASATPKIKREPLPAPKPEAPREKTPAPKRVARIVQAPATSADDREREREKLLARVLVAEGRSAVTRAAREYAGAGFEFPCDQATQLKLLEHLDEDVIRGALEALAQIFEGEPVTKRPLLEQRLKRLEDAADDAATRSAASELRRSLR